MKSYHEPFFLSFQTRQQASAWSGEDERHKKGHKRCYENK